METWEFEPPDTDAVCEICGAPLNCLGECPDARQHMQEYWSDMEEGDPYVEDCFA